MAMALPYKAILEMAEHFFGNSAGGRACSPDGGPDEVGLQHVMPEQCFQVAQFVSRQADDEQETNFGGSGLAPTSVAPHFGPKACDEPEAEVVSEESATACGDKDALFYKALKADLAAEVGVGASLHHTSAHLDGNQAVESTPIPGLPEQWGPAANTPPIEATIACKEMAAASELQQGSCGFPALHSHASPWSGIGASAKEADALKGKDTVKKGCKKKGKKPAAATAESVRPEASGSRAEVNGIGKKLDSGGKPVSLAEDTRVQEASQPNSASGLGPPFAAQAAADPTDDAVKYRFAKNGKAYQYNEFIEFYGNECEWLMARPARRELLRQFADYDGSTTKKYKFV